jgi:hypothetical protein
MNIPLNTEEPFAYFIARQEKGHRCSAAYGEMLAPLTQIRMAYDNIHASGHLADACQRWEQRDPATAAQTWAAFTAFFSHAYQLRAQQATTGTTGFPQAAAITNTKDAEIGQLQQQVAALTRQMRALAGGGGRQQQVQQPAQQQPRFYCWSHGLGFNPNHTSGSCGNRLAGHEANATDANRMGGNNQVKPWKPRA